MPQGGAREQRAERRLGDAGGAEQDHKRIPRAPEAGTPGPPLQGPHTPAQAGVAEPLPPAAHGVPEEVCCKGRQPRLRRGGGPPALLADNRGVQADPLPGRAREDDRGHAAVPLAPRPRRPCEAPRGLRVEPELGRGGPRPEPLQERPCDPAHHPELPHPLPCSHQRPLRECDGALGKPRPQGHHRGAEAPDGDRPRAVRQQLCEAPQGGRRGGGPRG
mmetsp:Transcript_92479/g.293280  ORF Transcript_92479/g.293280 Transcript_92479/m.293280 type:complete len:218 (-) Transcript_92479:135-788(-)